MLNTKMKEEGETRSKKRKKGPNMEQDNKKNSGSL